jgi:hypothetical protein
MKEITQNHEQSFRALLDNNRRSNICAISISGRRKYGTDRKMRALVQLGGRALVCHAQALGSVLSTEKKKKRKTKHLKNYFVKTLWD